MMITTLNFYMQVIYFYIRYALVSVLKPVVYSEHKCSENSIIVKILQGKSNHIDLMKLLKSLNVL